MTVAWVRGDDVMALAAHCMSAPRGRDGTARGQGCPWSSGRQKAGKMWGEGVWGKMSLVSWLLCKTRYPLLQCGDHDHSPRCNKSGGGEHVPPSWPCRHPQASPSAPTTVQGMARAPLATFWAPFLALCCDSNAEGVALVGGGRPVGRGRQKNTESAGHWGYYTALLDKKYTLQWEAASRNGEEAERTELTPTLWQLSQWAQWGSLS